MFCNLDLWWFLWYFQLTSYNVTCVIFEQLMMHINKHGEMFIVDISCKAYKNFPVTSHCSPDNVVFMNNFRRLDLERSWLILIDRWSIYSISWNSDNQLITNVELNRQHSGHPLCDVLPICEIKLKSGLELRPFSAKGKVPKKREQMFFCPNTVWLTYIQ